MQLDIDGSSLVRRPLIRRHIEDQIRSRLGPFAGRIGTVRVRLRERAPSEATRALCGIGVTLEPRDDAGGAWLLARAEDDDVRRAVDRAVERVAMAVGEEVARRDRELAMRAHEPVALVRTGLAERV